MRKGVGNYRREGGPTSILAGSPAGVGGNGRAGPILYSGGSRAIYSRGGEGPGPGGGGIVG